MIPQGIFITGTDTGVGKTWVTLGLMQRLAQAGRTVLGMKPVATGCQVTAEGLRNEDALRILRQGSDPVPYEWVNPYAFEPAIAPHVAAQEQGLPIDFDVVLRDYQRLARQAQHVIVEGVGGWEVPLNDHARVSDLAGALGLPLVLVVGMRLGCLNHALLTAEAIELRGLRLAGWVGNHIDVAMERFEENVAALRSRIGAPCLGVIPYFDKLDPLAVASALRTEVLACWRTASTLYENNNKNF
jgi:dethiobiotin synthetase